MKNLMKLLLCCCLLLSTRAMDGVSCPNKVSGSVTCEGKALQGVVVTDGFDVVQTDAQGRYELPMNRGARFVYLSSPAGYLAPLVGSHVGFYQRLKEGNNQYDNAVIIKRKDNGKIIACVENDVNRQLHDFIIQNEGKVHALYYIWKYGKNRIYGCAYIKNKEEHR